MADTNPEITTPQLPWGAIKMADYHASNKDYVQENISKTESKLEELNKEPDRSQIKTMMEYVNSVVTAVSNKFSTNPVYTSFLEFRMNDLIINTTSTNVNHNLLMSFDHRKNGSGYANSFTITIAYAPQMGENFDVNYIDRALTLGHRAGYRFSSRFCTLTYGYADSTSGLLRTKTYEGLVMDYTCDIQNSMLVYTITGYSGITIWKESKDPISLNGARERKTDGTYEQPRTDGTIRPTTAVRYIVENVLGDLYDIKFDGGVENSDKPIIIPAQVDKNPAKAITDILSKAVNEKQDKEREEQKKNIAVNDKITYSWFVSDEREGDKKGTIWVTMLNPRELNKQEADASLVFNWMSPGGSGEINHIVQQFRPSFNGAVLLSIASEKLNPRTDKTQADTGETVEKELFEGTYNYEGAYFLDDDGVVKPIESYNAPPAGGDIDTVTANIESEKATWARKSQYPYKASMVTMGIPCEIPITGLIKVVPLIYGKPHFSAGVYMVLGVRDTITSGGVFSTEWELLKMVQEEEQETYYEEPKTEEQPDKYTPEEEVRHKWTTSKIKSFVSKQQGGN